MLAIARAMVSASLVNSPSGGKVETVFTLCDQRFLSGFFLAVIVLRVKRPDWPRPFRAPGYPFLPLLYAAAGTALIAILLKGNPKTTWPGYAIVLAGVPVYFLWRRRARSAGQ